MQKIGDVRGSCSACGWWGTVGEAEPDVDGDGSLGCPQCMSVVNFGAPNKARNRRVPIATHMKEGGMDEFNRRCEKAVEELAKIAYGHLGDKNEYNRLMGKIEGMQLVQDFANEMLLTKRATERNCKWYLCR